ncbi:ABC transporter substrate-binding protein [Nonomuraea sp. NBC_01738]|uniref:ABC transporter substrate-binding protein n=1 Tax=Nonomuraea sp. NBC_01738 TaxID=2976003 RepID=UPI002E11F61F|nr:ABC transporter substrate-binding protein [Nonomuraea sp. NBC_01738]
MRRRLAAVALAFSIAACSAPTEVRQAPPGESAFVYAQNLDVVTDWDPASSYSNDIIAFQNIYETLTIWNPVTKKAGPRLATSWNASADGKSWTFRLRSGVTFHTGKPLDAAAVKASVERTMKAGAGASYIWDSVESIQVTGPLSVTFSLKYAAPLDLTASAAYSAYIYDTSVVEQAKSGKIDAGSGPYTIDKWQKGAEDELTLKAYPGYWGGWDRPHYRTVKYRVVPDPGQAWRQLQSGEVSFVQRLSPRLFARAAVTPGVRTSRMPSFQTAMMLFNTVKGPLRDVRVRRALQRAVDYRGLIRALDGAGVAASGIVPEGLPGHERGRVPSQDLAEAARLLQRAGYGPNGRPLRLSLTYAEGDADQRALVVRLAATLRTLNVTLDARAMPWLAQWELGKKRGQDIFVMYWWPDYADGYSWFGNVFRSGTPPVFNLTYLKDPATDSMIDQLPVLNVTDRAAAAKAIQQTTTRLIDLRAVAALPWVVRYQRAYLGGISGYDDNPAYPDVVFVYDLRPSA